jgi:hypothetical protein
MWQLANVLLQRNYLASIEDDTDSKSFAGSHKKAFQNPVMRFLGQQQQFFSPPFEHLALKLAIENEMSRLLLR